MFNIIHAAFNQRRKTMMNALSNLGIVKDKETIKEALDAVGLDENIRGEALTLTQFAAFSDAVLARRL